MFLEQPVDMIVNKNSAVRFGCRVKEVHIYVFTLLFGIFCVSISARLDRIWEQKLVKM